MTGTSDGAAFFQRAPTAEGVTRFEAAGAVCVRAAVFDLHFGDAFAREDVEEVLLRREHCVRQDDAALVDDDAFIFAGQWAREEYFENFTLGRTEEG